MLDGIVYVATGPDYRAAAVQSALSVRAHSPGLLIDIFTDEPPDEAHVFDKVVIIENPHRRSKVDHIHRSRFDRTLYLDSDTRVVTDISDMFGILERYDLAVAHAHARNRKATQETWRVPIPSAFPQVNSGVMLFRRSDLVLELLRAWRDAFHEAGISKDQVTFRELIWRSDLRLCILPPRYNIRYSRYLDFWPGWEARPKILHYAEFHKMHEGEERSASHRSSIFETIRKKLKAFH